MIFDASHVHIQSGSYVQIGSVDLEYDPQGTLTSTIQIFAPDGYTIADQDILFVERQVKVESSTETIINYDLCVDVEKLPLFTDPTHPEANDQKVCISIKHPSDRFDMLFLINRYRNEKDNEIYDSFGLTRPHRRSFVYSLQNNYLKDPNLRVLISRISNKTAEQIYQELFI